VARLIVLYGPSGSGKSEVASRFENYLGSRSYRPNKLTTRDGRSGVDDVQSSSKDELLECDLAYALNGEIYGFRSIEISEALDRDQWVVLIASDLSVVERLRQRFSGLCVVIYVSSPVNRTKLLAIHLQRHVKAISTDEREALAAAAQRLLSAARVGTWSEALAAIDRVDTAWEQAVENSKQLNVRASKLTVMHARYIDHIATFDHTILNYGSLEDLARQADTLLAKYDSGELPRKPGVAPYLYVVAAPSGAGKKTLMEAVGLIGSRTIGLATKYALRDEKPEDGGDGMIALGRDGVFPPQVDFQWEFHDPPVPYGVSSGAIRSSLETGRPLLVVSNIGQFDGFNRRFGDRVKFLYLHVARSREEVAAYQERVCATKAESDARMAELDKVFSHYTGAIDRFHHVILNTTDVDDLVNQFMRVLAADLGGRPGIARSA
jgi:guanylate kinase